MKLYLGTSALVLLLVAEPASARRRALWESVETIESTKLKWTWSSVPADAPRLRAVAQLAVCYPLLGYDAVHCAAALAVSADDLVAASGDTELVAARRAEGLAVVDTTR